MFALTGGVAIAQQQPANQSLVPVDQAVGDLDRLSTSMRVIQPGLSPFGDRTRLYRLQTPWSPYLPGATPGGMDDTYYRIGPGVRARVDRLDYLIPLGKRNFDLNVAPRRDGQFIELAPPGTVYDLRPIPLIAPNAAGVPSGFPIGNASIQPQPSNAIDRRVQGQVQPQMIEGRLDGRASQSSQR